MSAYSVRSLTLNLLNNVRNGQVPADIAVEIVVALTDSILRHREHLLRLAIAMDMKSGVVTVGDPDHYAFQARALSDKDWEEFMYEISDRVAEIKSLKIPKK